jgi:hypothetical protein
MPVVDERRIVTGVITEADVLSMSGVTRGHTIRQIIRHGPKEIVWSMLSSFAGIGACCYLSGAYLEPRDLTLIIASFCASAVLICSGQTYKGKGNKSAWRRIAGEKAMERIDSNDRRDKEIRDGQH